MKHQGKVFGIGLSKTGTSSLSEALSELGIPSVHWPNDPRTFRELASGNFRLSILEEFDAILDTPIPSFYPQFDKVYPGSKFILTVRDLDSWLSSMQFNYGDHPLLDVQDETGNLGPLTFKKYCRAVVYGTLEYNEDRYRYAFMTHHREVRRYFKDRQDDLLVLDVFDGEGWEKLCDFLGAKVPNTKFPHTKPWNSRVRKAVIELKNLVTRECPFIAAGSMSFYLGKYWESVTPFTERNGKYWGPPASSTEAIKEFDRCRSSGAEYLVFGFPEFWWLDNYHEFNQYLRSTFPSVADNALLKVFDLRNTS